MSQENGKICFSDNIKIQYSQKNVNPANTDPIKDGKHRLMKNGDVARLADF